MKNWASVFGRWYRTIGGNMEWKLVIPANVELAETPIWDTRIHRLYWTDLFSGDIHRYDPTTQQTEIYRTQQLIGSAIPCDDQNQLLCALESGLYLLDLTTGKLSFLIDPDGNDHNRYNDTRCDSKGRIFTSSVSKAYGTDQYDPSMQGAFYMVDTDLKVQTITDGVQQYNGIVWNQSETRMFVIDTYHQCLLAFPYDSAIGPVGTPEVVIDFTDNHGMPDGLSIDSEDNLYVCHWSGKISVWNSRYQSVKVLDFPVEYVCCGGFGGDDLTDFYVATSKYCYTEAELAQNKGAGGIFKAQVTTKGRVDHYYNIRRN